MSRIHGKKHNGISASPEKMGPLSERAPSGCAFFAIDRREGFI